MLIEESIASNQNDVEEQDDVKFDDAAYEFLDQDRTDAVADDSHVESGKCGSDNKLSPEISSPSMTSTIRRRRSRIVADSADSSNPSSSVSFDYSSKVKERKLRFATKIMEKEKLLENLDVINVNNSSESLINPTNEESNELSTIPNENHERIENSAETPLNLSENEDINSNILLSIAGLVIKTVGFQINLLIYLISFPFWLIYTSCMFVMDPFGVIRHGRNLIITKFQRILGYISQCISPFVSEWSKKNESMWKFGLKCGYGFLWSVYVSIILLALLVGAFVMGGLIIRSLVEEPIRIKEVLNFDYTEKSPVVHVPLVACSGLDCGEDYKESIELGKISGIRRIPAYHKLQVIISLTLPESDYNRNLGMFQVRVEFLAPDGRTLASSKRPCMLQFQSAPIRLLLTFLKVAPLITGYTSESQNLNIIFKGFTEGNTPTACIKVTIEQRAQYQPAAGIPEIYASYLTLESELPLLKRLVWYWKKTLFVWISMSILTVELVFALLCCRPLIIPRIRLTENSGNGNVRRDNHLAIQSSTAT